MSAAAKLMGWRKRLDLTQREAAKKAGISQAAWQALEAGSNKRLGLDVAARIVDTTGGAVTLADLVTDAALARRVARWQHPTPPKRTGTDG